MYGIYTDGARAEKAMADYQQAVERYLATLEEARKSVESEKVGAWCFKKQQL